MVIGSHNSWSYLTPKKWWMKLLGFTAKCQKYNIEDQYFRFGVRCFDLRIRFDEEGLPVLCHGLIEYKYTYYELLSDLEFLNRMNEVTVRLLLELRGVPESQWEGQRKMFFNFHRNILKPFNHIKYVLGRDLPSWKKCIITLAEGKIEEKYASVTNPKYIDDWWPWLYAKTHNHKNIQKGTDKDILLLDFVNIQ